MTQVNSTTATQCPGALSIEEGSYKDSVAAVINSLTGTNKTGSELASERVSEDILFAAHVHKELSKSNPKLAKELLVELPKRYNKKLDNKKRQPLFRAVDSFLKKASKSGELTKGQRKQLTREAFGKAQLDSKETRLRRRVKQFDDVSESSNIDQSLARVESNEAATKREMMKFRRRIAARPELSKKQLERNRNFLNDIEGPEVPKKRIPAPTKPIAERPVLETDKKGALPSYLSIETEPHEFVYKPISEKGGALIQIPLQFSDEVTGVSLMSRQSDDELVLNHSGYGDDRRSYFRSDFAGNSLEGPLTAKLEFIDGSSAHFELGDADKFFSEEFFGD